MSDTLMVFVTCESSDQGQRIAQAVVSEKLAACVNVLPAIRSCYMWQNNLTWSDEVLLLIKTTRARFGQLQERVLALHSYELPEIVGVPIEEGLPKYLEWITASVDG